MKDYPPAPIIDKLVFGDPQQIHQVRCYEQRCEELDTTSLYEVTVRNTVVVRATDADQAKEIALDDLGAADIRVTRVGD